MSSEPVPDEFCKVLKDFIRDIKTTFPEYINLINKWWKNDDYFSYIDDEEERKQAIIKYNETSVRIVFDFAKKKYPPRFFDILYQNEEIFKESSIIDTEFLPHIHFKNLWQVELSEKTRETIWKYLQLILFSLVNTIHDKAAFGDSFKLLENIDENEFKTKLQEALEKIQTIFNTEEKKTENTNHFNIEDLPDVDGMHKHISGILDGKLGKLAKEIAAETAETLNIDMENITDTNDIFNSLLQNPGKLMGLFKNVGEKLEKHMKSGEINECELISEATDIMNKMKNIPGMNGIQELLSKFGMNKDTKINNEAMEASLNRKKKAAQMKERVQSKTIMKEVQKLKQTASQQNKSQEEARLAKITEDELIALFGSEKTKKNEKKKKNKKKT
jgi:hypothetical protein